MVQKKVGPGQVVGVTGLSIWRGVVGEEYLSALTGTRKARVFREMQDDTVISTLLDAISMPLLSAEFSVKPAGQLPQDKVNADFLKSVMDDMTRYSWRQHVLDMLSMLTWGWSASEFVFKKRLGPNSTKPSQYNDGLIGLHILDPRGQETLDHWIMNEEEFVPEAMVQLDPNNNKFIEIPAWKLLHSTFRSRKRSPEGTSPMNSLYKPWYTRKNLEVLEAIGAERDLAGLPVIYLPYGATDTDKAAAETLIRNLRQDEEAGLVIPAPTSPDAKHKENGWMIELLGSPGSKQFDARSIIQDLNKVILMRFFAQFLMLGMEQVGSQALVEGSQDFFSMCLISVQQELVETWNDQMVSLLFSFNPGLLVGASGKPSLAWAKPGSKDVAKLVQSLQGLVSARLLTPDTSIEDYVRTITALPDRAPGIGEGPRQPLQAPGPLQGLMSYDWKENPDGSYTVKKKSFSIEDEITATISSDVAKLKRMLDSGSSGEDVIKALSDEHSGFTAFLVIEQVVAGSKNGEVLRKAWNTHLGEPDAKGLIDPSIITMSFREKGSWKKFEANLGGAMLAIAIPEAVASQIAVPGGEAVKDLHITLFYFGDVADIEDPKWIEQIAGEELEKWTDPLHIVLNGTKTFTPSKSSDGEAPFVAKVESARLLALRKLIANAFDDAGIDYSKDFEFTPHVTLKYLAKDEPVPEVKVQADFVADRVFFVTGPEWTALPMAVSEKVFADVQGIAGRRQDSKIGEKTNAYQSLLTTIYDDWAVKAHAAILTASTGKRTQLLKEVDKQLLRLAKDLKGAAGQHLEEAVKLGFKKDLDREGQRLVSKQVETNNKFVDESLIPRIREKIVSHLADLQNQPDSFAGTGNYAIDDTALLALLNSMRTEPTGYAGAYWAAVFMGAGLGRKDDDRSRVAAGQKPHRVRWVLDPAAEHCKQSEFHHGCPDLEGEYQSWDDLPTVPAGDVTCLGNCRCHIDVETEDGGWDRVA